MKEVRGIKNNVLWQQITIREKNQLGKKLFSEQSFKGKGGLLLYKKINAYLDFVTPTVYVSVV
jgi:hypothetical protein